MALSAKQEEIKAEFIKVRGGWSDGWQQILELDDDFIEAYTNFSAVPWRTGPLDPKVKEFVYIAVDAAATHLYEPGIRQHVKQALSLGATAAEIMEVLELTATLGIHACTIGVPILLEELEASGQSLPREFSARQEALKEDFERKRGYWNDFWNEMVLLDPDFFESYIHFSSVPWLSGTLEPKVKELIYTAFDVSATHLYVSGLRQHIRNALDYGATREEVLEVIELASVIGTAPASRCSASTPPPARPRRWAPPPPHRPPR